MNYYLKFLLSFALALPATYSQQAFSKSPAVTNELMTRLVSKLNKSFSIDKAEIRLLKKFDRSSDQKIIRKHANVAKAKLKSEKIQFLLEKKSQVAIHYFGKKQFDLSIVNSEKEVVSINGRKISLKGKSYEQIAAQVKAILNGSSHSLLDFLVPKAYAGASYAILAILLLYIYVEYEVDSAKSNIKEARREIFKARMKCEKGDKKASQSDLKQVKSLDIELAKKQYPRDCHDIAEEMAIEILEEPGGIELSPELKLYCDEIKKALRCNWPELHIEAEANAKGVPQSTK